MVDTDIEEDKSDKATVEQCSTTLSMFDRNSFVTFSHLDSMLAYVT